MIANQKLSKTVNLTVHDVQGCDPLNAKDDGGALENAFTWKGKIVRVPFAPPYLASSSANKVWRLIPFQFTRDSAIEQQLIIVKSDGKTYKLQGGEMEQNTSCPVTWVRKPASAIRNNRLHLSDGANYYIWDGWTWVSGGLTAPITAPAGSGFSGTGLTGTYSFAQTWVQIRSNAGVDTRVHESSRSAINANIVCANQGVTFNVPGSPPARATHWSLYMSEISGSSVYRRSVTLSI